MKRKSLDDQLDRLLCGTDRVDNIIKGVDLFRIREPASREPIRYEPGIIVLVQGAKRVYAGEQTHVYDTGHFLILSVPLPLACDTLATPDVPVMGLRIRVDAAEIGEMLLAMKEDAPPPAGIPEGLGIGLFDDRMQDATSRLLEALATEAERRFLAPMAVREILFRVLSCPEGNVLRALAYRNQNFHRIARVLDRIHQSGRERFDLPEMARESGMSLTAFHANFKAVTHTSPLQYVKGVKLHMARRLLVEQDCNASEAAYRVGYESPSQFSREYKRMFGVSPGKDETPISV